MVRNRLAAAVGVILLGWLPVGQHGVAVTAVTPFAIIVSGFIQLWFCFVVSSGKTWPATDGPAGTDGCCCIKSSLFIRLSGYGFGQLIPPACHRTPKGCPIGNPGYWTTPAAGCQPPLWPRWGSRIGQADLLTCHKILLAVLRKSAKCPKHPKNRNTPWMKMLDRIGLPAACNTFTFSV